MASSSNQRDIGDVLRFRRDLSPFLTHLTKSHDGEPGSTVLTKIITTRELKQSSSQISDMRFQFHSNFNEKQKLVSAICLTETPLNEIHCLLNISHRSVQLEPYGLVFLKEHLITKHVYPCIYLNNWTDDFDGVVSKLGEWAEANIDIASNLIPLIACYGNLLPAKSGKKTEGTQDFYWEREWRLPYCHGNLKLDLADIFCGLCPNSEIETFEQLIVKTFGTTIPFIDPLMPATYFAKKLVDRRKHLSLEESVV